MITGFSTVESMLAEYFGERVEIVSSRSIGGGCINQAKRLNLSNGVAVFQKENRAELENMFLAEALGLEALQVDGGPKVPRSIGVVITESTQTIVMEYVEQGRPGEHYWEAFGRSFARLHLSETAGSFGFEVDNYIGATPQCNASMDDWIGFYGQHRLGYQIELAQKRGLAPSGLVKKTRQLIDRLAHYLPGDVVPSVLHGDLWSGNAIVGADGDAVIIDPAVYWGHNEADLAMTELFGRFDNRFYAAYGELNPIDPEYETRREIYNLYHILNHLNLFGPSYGAQALSILNRLL